MLGKAEGSDLRGAADKEHETSKDIVSRPAALCEAPLVSDAFPDPPNNKSLELSSISI